RITVEQVLAHRSGVLTFEGLRRGELFDYPKAIAAIERQKPAWPDASRGAYHTSTYGPLLAELVRRVTGERIEDFFERRVNQPLGTAYRFRTRDEELDLTAHVIEPRFSTLRSLLFYQPYFLRMARAWWPLPPLGRLGFNSPLFLQSGFNSGAGTGTARSVARIFSELACASETSVLLRPETLRRATQPSWENVCWTSGIPTRMTLGFAMNTQGGAFFGPGEHSFGHAGRGGSFGFADPERRLGFCYCTNRLTRDGLPDARSQRLVAELYDALGRAG
ncbi:MAG TPA: serine hydrolase domain-containing protein, partial [Archangium sp.]